MRLPFRRREDEGWEQDRRAAVDATAAVLALARKPMLIIDGDTGHIVQANVMAYRLFGPPLVGAELDRIVPARHRAAHKAHRKDYMHFPVARPMGVGIEVHAATSDGSEVLIETGLTPIPTTRLVIVDVEVLK